MMMRGFLSLMMCCLLWGTAYSQITYDITGVWENGAGRTIRVRTLEDGNVEGEFLDSVVVADDGTFALRGSQQEKMCDVDECEEWVPDDLSGRETLAADD